MPIYEYHCQNCQQKFELIRSFSDADAKTECQNCHSQDVKRQLSKVSVFSNGSSISSSNCSGCSSGNCSACGI